MKVLSGSILLILVLGLALSAEAFQARRFKKGEKVQVEVGGEMVTGEVVGFGANDWVTIKYKTKNGIEKSPSFPPSRVLPANAKAGKQAKGSKAKEPAESDEPSETRSGESRSGGKFRNWSDKSGKFSIKARFVEVDGDEVTLEKEDGKQVSIPLAKLRDADRKLAEELSEDDPFKPKGDNPFREKGEGDDGDDEPEIEVSEVDWSRVKTITIQDPPLWSQKPDSGPQLDKPLVTKPVMLFSAVKSRNANAEVGFFNKVEGLFLNQGTGEACVVSIDSDPSQTTKVMLQRADLKTGKALAPVAFPSPVRPLDVDSAGARVVTAEEMRLSRGHVTAKVNVWDFGEKSLRHVRTWDAHDPGDFHNTAPTSAQFLDADHVFTISFPHKLAMFDINEARAVYRMELGSSAAPAVSPGRKYLAVAAKPGVVMLDALTGEPLAKLPGDPGWVSSMSFHPSGRYFAALSHQRLVVWDLESGTIFRDIYFSTPFHTTEIDWVSDGYMLLGSEKLVDLERRIVLWNYQCESQWSFSRSYGTLGGGFWYTLTSKDRKERGLFRVLIPHDEALKTAKALNPDEILALRPGSQVSLQMMVQGAPADQNKAAQDLSAQLQRLGMTVVNGGRLVLQATTEAGKTEQVTYNAFGAGIGGGTPVSVTNQISRLRLFEDGKVIWEASGTFGAPPILHLKQGESIQQALAPYQVPNLGFFSDVKLPETIARPHPSGAYGASTISHLGIQSAPLPPPQTGAAGM